MVRKHIVVSGRVQGVGFRYHVSMIPSEFNLTGWVLNLSSGAVEMEIQGEEENVAGFLKRIGNNTTHIRIDFMDIEDCRVIEETQFRVKY